MSLWKLSGCVKPIHECLEELYTLHSLTIIKFHAYTICVHRLVIYLGEIGKTENNRRVIYLGEVGKWENK
jgi:hypothetical protein